MTKRTQPDYVKRFQDALNDFVQDLHPMGGMLTGAITIVEMIDSNGKYFLHVLDDNKSLSFFLFISTLAQKHVSRQAITTSSSIFSRACYKNPEGVTFYT